MGGGRGALSTLPRNETCGPPLCHLYGADRRDAEKPAARQLEWRVASEQEVTTLRPVGRISAHDRRPLGAAASRCPLWGHSLDYLLYWVIRYLLVRTASPAMPAVL